MKICIFLLSIYVFNFNCLAQEVLETELEVLTVTEHEADDICELEDCQELTHSDVDQLEAEIIAPALGREYVLSTRLLGGTSLYYFIGSASDFPKRVNIGIENGIILCRGICETYFSFIRNSGGRSSDLVTTRYREIRSEVTFLLVPIRTKIFRLAVGGSIGLSRGHLNHDSEYADIRTKVVTGHFGLALQLMVDVRHQSNSRSTRTFALGLEGRLNLDRVMSSCSDIITQSRFNQPCLGPRQLRTIEMAPFATGGDIQARFIIEARFERRR